MTSHSPIDVQLLNHPVQYKDADERFFEHLKFTGGECVFLGRTRIETHPIHGTLQRLAYEAYAPMAEAVLQDLAQQAVQNYSCAFVRIHHAICEVPPGEASVLVQTFCAHRDKAFASCRFLIDELKSQAPIWKREQWADGSTWSKGVQVVAKELR